ncbi:MAG: glycosyltransferase family protein [Acidimicrobiales bacterium]
MTGTGESIATTAEHRAIQLGWDPSRPRSTTGPRLLIYSQDGLGLGHLRRTTSIANEFLRVRPDAAVLTVSDSPLGTFFGMAPNHDYLKLPSLLKTGPTWQALSLPMASGELLALRRGLITSVATGFRPDLVLVDHMPHGASGELLSTLEILSRTSTKVVLGLRDILDAPEVTHHHWATEGAFEAVDRYYDSVLVYGSRNVFDVAHQYRWGPATAGRLRYCGYVCAPNAARNARRIRSRCLNGSGNSQLIVAMAGGGHDAYPLMDSLLRALPEIRESVAASLLIITGPFMPTSLRRDLVARSAGLPVQVRTSSPDMFGHIAAADLVVSMAGYNTTVEILRSGTPLVLVPRRGPSAEQRLRSGLFAERDWAGLVDPAELSSRALAHAVLDRLELGGRVPATAPDFGGLGLAVEHLNSVLSSAPPASAQPLVTPPAWAPEVPAPALRAVPGSTRPAAC